HQASKKLQTPNPKLQRSTKHQAANLARGSNPGFEGKWARQVSQRETMTFQLFPVFHGATIASASSVATNRKTPVSDAVDAGQSAPDVLERLVQEAERADASDIHLHICGSAASV